MLQSVTCVQHNSNAKLRMLWMYALGRDVDWVFTAEGSSPIEIHRRLRSVCSEDAIDVSSDTGFMALRAVKGTLVTSPAAADQPRQRRRWPKTRLMRWYRMTVASRQINCSPHSGWKTSSYGHHQRTWLHVSLREVGAENADRRTQNSPKKHLCRTSLAQRERRRCFTVKNNYRWWNLGSSLRPTEKTQSMEWHHQSSPRKKEFNVRIKSWPASSGTVKELLVEFLERGATVHRERYVQTLNKLKQRIRWVRPNRKMNQVPFLHDNARPHTSLRTREAIKTMGRTVLPHPPDLAPSDFHLFGPLKDALRGCHFADDDELKHSLHEELRRCSKVLRHRHRASHVNVEKVCW
jgi:hypothetical protein